MGTNDSERTYPGQLTEEIEPALTRHQGEVEASTQRLFIESKGQSRRRTTKVRPEWGDRRDDALKILEGSIVDDVEVISDPRGSM